MNKPFLIGIILLILGSCQDGCNRKTDATARTKSDSLLSQLPAIQDNPAALRALDSIPPPTLKDTAGLDETGKDSIKYMRIFQLAANALCKAELDRNYELLAAFAPEGVIKRYGNKTKYIERLKSYDKDRPNIYKKILAGPAQRIAPATDDDGFAGSWYCLMPVRSYRTDASGKEVVDLSWMGGKTDLNGKNTCFLNVTRLSREQIQQVMPDLTFVLD